MIDKRFQIFQRVVGGRSKKHLLIRISQELSEEDIKHMHIGLNCGDLFDLSLKLESRCCRPSFDLKNCIVEFINPKDPALCKHCLREYEAWADLWDWAGKGEL